MRLRTPALACFIASSSWLVGCTSPSDEESVGRIESALAHPGPWQIPADTLAIGDTQYVEYTGAGPWLGESGCSGGIMSGTDILRDYLYAHFPQTDDIGGYSCRPIVGNESQMSVHATGRALDIMLPLDNGEADNDLGDPIGNWLVENAEAIGIQFIIWDRYDWMAERATGNKGDDYGGQHPHHDHLHVELSVAMASQTTNWFEDAVEPPAIDGCQPLRFIGGLVEETDACFVAFGPAQYWRSVDDGHGGTLLWTNAFENDKPANWARWNLVFAARGTYDVEIYVDPDWGVHTSTRYGIQHSEGTAVVEIDQSTQQEWVSLGEYMFDPQAEQHVSVYDDMPAAVAPDQHIAVDAVRVSRVGSYPIGNDPGGASDDDGEVPAGGNGTPEAGESDAGCSASAHASPTPYWTIALAFIGIGACARRRRPRA